MCGVCGLVCGCMVWCGAVCGVGGLVCVGGVGGGLVCGCMVWCGAVCGVMSHLSCLCASPPTRPLGVHQQ